ncbi:MAG: hypothetical protein ACYC91_02620 [Solirubrobacteraceae bacterium]
MTSILNGWTDRSRLWAAAVLIGLMATAASASSAQADGMPTVLTAGGSVTSTLPDGAPLPTAVPLGGQGVSVASRQVTALQAGETLNVSVEAEVTNDVIVSNGVGGYRWLDTPVSSQIILASTPEATVGTLLASAAGGTISWREHHSGVVRDGTLVVPAQLAGQTMYVNLVLASTQTSPPARCFDYNRQTATFAPAAAGCALHVENDHHLVSLDVLRMPPGGGSGYSTHLIGQATPSDSYLPIPADSSSPEYGAPHVVWSSAPIQSLHTGDVIQASVRLQASIQDLIGSLALPSSEVTGCNVMLSGHLFLSPYPDRLPSPGDPLGNAVPSLDGSYAFNLTQSQPQSVATWQGDWTSDGNYTTAQTPARYVVLVAWASGGAACPHPVSLAGAQLGAATSLRISGAGSGGYVVSFSPSTPAASSQEGDSAAGANAATQLGGASHPQVISVVPVRVEPGDVVIASAQAALANSSAATGDVQLVLGSSYAGPNDTSGTPISPSGQAILEPGTDRALVQARGALQATTAQGSPAMSYIKLVAWSAPQSASGAASVDAASTRLLVHLLRSGSMPSASDFPAPPPVATPVAPAAPASGSLLSAPAAVLTGAASSVSATPPAVTGASASAPAASGTRLQTGSLAHPGGTRAPTARNRFLSQGHSTRSKRFVRHRQARTHHRRATRKGRRLHRRGA